MRLAFRLLALLVVVPSTYFFIFWTVFSFVPVGDQVWISMLGSLLSAMVAGWYVWTRSGEGQTSLISCIFLGAFLLGGIGFVLGFFGPMLFAPGANQGPLLGLIITGPLGFVLGGIGGFVYWWNRKRQPEPIPLFSWKGAVPVAISGGVLLILVAIPEYRPVMPCFFAGDPPRTDRNQLQVSDPLYFVPLGDFPKDTAHRLAQYYQDKYALKIEVVPPKPIPEAVLNQKRRQYESERLITYLQGELAPLLPSSETVVIALTDEDIYIASKNWQYAFSYRSAPFAVVSLARMDHGFLGLWKASDEKIERRFRKMLTKNIGQLYFHLPPSGHCRSVMYGNIMGPQELDFMNEEF